jgi:hypothetical protein
MKKLLTIAFALLLGASLSFAQATGGTEKPAPKTDTKAADTKAADTKTSNTKSGKKGHKGGKKGKKSSGSTTTPPPK